MLDADTALRIGLRAIEERLGQAVLEKYRPYEAVLSRKEWIVTGNIDPNGEFAKMREAAGPDTFVIVRGSVAQASISAEDGRVLAVSLGRWTNPGVRAGKHDMGRRAIAVAPRRSSRPLPLLSTARDLDQRRPLPVAGIQAGRKSVLS